MSFLKVISLQQPQVNSAQTSIKGQVKCTSQLQGEPGSNKNKYPTSWMLSWKYCVHNYFPTSTHYDVWGGERERRYFLATYSGILTCRPGRGRGSGFLPLGGLHGHAPHKRVVHAHQDVLGLDVGVNDFTFGVQVVQPLQDLRTKVPIVASVPREILTFVTSRWF